MQYQGDVECAFGTWELDLGTDESRWSVALYEILGLTADPALGPSTYTARIHPGDLARVAVALDGVRREGLRLDVEHRIVRPDASVRLVRLRAWRSGDASTLVALVEDVTSHAAITDRLSSVSAFAAGVAHEINNPLGFISANLELIALETHAPDGTPEEQARARELDVLVREARHGLQRIRTVVRGLMTFSRIEPTHHEPLDVNRVMEVAIGITSNEIRPRARLVRNFGVVPLVDANAARLGQVFVHLLLNAAQSIPLGRPDDHQIAVMTRVDSSGRVLIDVTDTGGGIPREIGERVFDAFFTTRAAGAGPGLGLSACRNIVNALGGEIGFESERGHTVFHVVLPVGTGVEAAVAVEPPVAAARRGHVLIVDDEVTFAGSLRRLLSRDHEVTVIHDGRQAFERLRSGERFDAIISDLMMPGLGGIELYTALAAFAIEQAERMIFITGGFSGTTGTEFLDRVTNPCFDKPCDLDALRSAIRRLVG